MNKSEQREVSRIIAHDQHLGADFAARSLSALYRASTRNKAKTEMLLIADHASGHARRVVMLRAA